MSDPLDLSTPAATKDPVAAATTAAATPSTSQELVLVPPPAVTVVAPDKAESMMPADAAAEQLVNAKATEFVDAIVALDPKSPEFGRKVADIDKMGQREIQESSQVSNRMLQRPAAALDAARGGGKDGNGQKVVANELVKLRRQVEDLDPGQVGFSPKKLLGLIPMGNTVRDYFNKYQSSQKNLDSIIMSLKSGQDELRKDNAAIDGEKVNLWQTMEKLRNYAALAKAIDGQLESKISELSLTDSERADTLKQDMLFPVRQKHQDILTQLAVCAQGYLALDMVRRNNLELIKGVDRATTTTVAALRTAVIVAQALANQKLVLDQITAINTTTSNLIVSTSEMLKTQTADIHNQAASTTVSVDALKQAFQNIYDTMDAIDTFKSQAVDNMAQTVQVLETENERAKSYLERARSRQANEGVQLPGEGA